MKHSTTLKTSLLVAMGIVPAACGGSTRSDENPSDGITSAGKSTAGSPASSDENPSDGMTSAGKSAAGAPANAGSGGSAKPANTRPRTKLGECTSPTLDPQTGLTTCAEGIQHRPQPVRCASTGVAGSGGMGGSGGSGGGSAPPEPRCAEDCSLLPNGFCGYMGQTTACKAGCVEDSDCGAGFLCACGNPLSPTGGTCVPSDCRTDADCGEGFCAAAISLCGDALLRCQREVDECETSADCDFPGQKVIASCIVNGTASLRTCYYGYCGRPFLVCAEARLPPVVATTAWSLSASPRTDQLTLAERAALAAHWSKLGQMEHASIAAFARFSLQLLSLGAPPALVEACTQALADETAHTQLCFGIASAYAGRAIGPGPLDVSGSLAVTSLADIVDLVLAEGCFGETSAALEALEAADRASDPVIAAAYAQIARDEQRHAELAFRFVAWALEREPVAVSERIEAALRSELGQRHAARSVAVPCLSALAGLARAA